MYKNSSIFLIFILLLVACDNTPRGRRHGNNLFVQTEQVVKQKKESLQFKKGEEFSVKVVGVTDGDTFTGLTADNIQVKCRIYGIDAPETRNGGAQPFCQKSKQTLSDLIFGKQVQIKIQNKDRWQRAVVWVYTSDGKDISAEMLKAGMAWHYKQYSKDNEYAELENAARKQKIGLWADKNPVAPWEWRKKK